MQNEISNVYLKEGILGKFYLSGKTDVRQIFMNGVNRSFRAYVGTSDQCANLLIVAPVNKADTKVELFQELELKNPRIVAVTSRIQQGRDRSTYTEYFIEADSAKGVK